MDSLLFVPFDQRLIQVEPNLEESIWGYIHRVAQAYQLVSLRPLLQKLTRGGARPYSVSIVPMLARLGGASEEELYKLSGFDASYEAGKSIWRFGGEVVHHFPSVGTRSLRVCPACLRNEGFVAGMVHLSPVNACVWHGLYLLVACKRCGKSLNTDRPALGRCTCGEDFSIARSPMASEEDKIFSTAVYSRIVGAKLPGGIAAGRAGEICLTALALDDLLFVHWALGHVLPRPRSNCLGTRRRLTNAESLAATKVCMSILRDPKLLLPIMQGWYDALSESDAERSLIRPGIFRSILQRLVRMKALAPLAYVIVSELKRLSQESRVRPSLGPRAHLQLDIFEDQSCI